MRHDLPFGSRNGTSLRYYIPLDAEYIVTIELNGNSEEGADLYELRLPIKAGVRTLAVAFMAGSTKSETASPAFGRSMGGGSESSLPMDVRLDGARIKLLELPPGRRKPLTGIAYRRTLQH